MSGDLNLPYEDVPDGPFVMDAEMLPCGGVVVKAAVLPTPDGQRMPALVFDFFLADGDRLPSICLVMGVDETLALTDLVRGAVRSAVREARRAA